MYVANTPGYTSFTVFPQPDTPLWADGTILYYGNLRGEWLQAESSGKVLAHEVPSRSCACSTCSLCFC